MIHEGMGMFNVAELAEAPPHAGLRLQRLPSDVRAGLGEGGQVVAQWPGGCEIRFVPHGPVRVTLSSPGESPGRVTVFWGPFQTLTSVTLGPEPQTIEVVYPDTLDAVAERVGPYRPNVCRLVCYYGPVHLHGVEGSLRPPAPSEVPARRFVAYGTSITHGFHATATHLSYVSQAAWRLGVDVVNLGLAGNAHCEPAMADHIASRGDWDFASLCLSVNMAAGGWTLEAFTERVGDFVDRIAKGNPDRPVVCITMFPYHYDFGTVPPHSRQVAPAEDFRSAVRYIGSRHENVHVLEGPDLLRDVGGLCDDLVHPGDLGMIQMGQRLAEELRALGVTA